MRAILAVGLLAVAVTRAGVAGDGVTFDAHPDHVQIDVGGQPLATYVFRDESILRPYLAHVHASSGVQVTRNHPPLEGTDRTDHDTMHPGIWLAFGDLSGADFWRNKAQVEHVEFVEKPTTDSGGGHFVVRNRYLDEQRLVCEELCRITIRPAKIGTFIIWDSRFSGPEAFAFGDQEEMGLGLRVATPLAVINGGRITNSEGGVDEKQVWGKMAAWCDYSGTIDVEPAGVFLLPDPLNFRPSWFHARDYGFVAANPFGRKAFTGGEPSKVEVSPGDSLRLRFVILIHSGPTDLEAGYRQAAEQLSETR